MLQRTSLFLLLNATFLLAAEEGHGGGDPLLPYKWINFAILAVLLLFAVVRYLLPMLNERSAAIQKDLAASREQVAQAEARIRELEAKLSNFDQELASIRTRMSEEREAEAKRISAQTAALLEKVQAQYALEVANTAKVAEQNLRAFTAEKALELAEARLRAEQSSSAQGGLVDSFVQDLKKVSAN